MLKTTEKFLNWEMQPIDIKINPKILLGTLYFLSSQHSH